MSVVPIQKRTTDNVIHLSFVKKEEPEVKYNKDGSVDKRHTNKVAGISSEVYPFDTKEKLDAMIDVFDEYIDNATNERQRKVAYRNKMLFLVGINIGLRASDLCTLKYNFFMNEDGTFKDSYKIQPKKTRKTGKYVKLYFNQAVKKAITDYIEKYPIQNMDDYLFENRNGGKAIGEPMLWKIINDAAIDAGLEGNYGSHSLRKTFGRWVWFKAKDKNSALIILQKIFAHSSPAITSKYIGLTDDEISEVYNELNLGLDLDMDSE